MKTLKTAIAIVGAIAATALTIFLFSLLGKLVGPFLLSMNASQLAQLRLAGMLLLFVAFVVVIILMRRRRARKERPDE